MLPRAGCRMSKRVLIPGEGHSGQIDRANEMEVHQAFAQAFAELCLNPSSLEWEDVDDPGEYPSEMLRVAQQAKLPIQGDKWVRVVMFSDGEIGLLCQDVNQWLGVDFMAAATAISEDGLPQPPKRVLH